jgi:hypothetical protein
MLSAILDPDLVAGCWTLVVVRGYFDMIGRKKPGYDGRPRTDDGRLLVAGDLGSGTRDLDQTTLPAIC